MRRITSYGIIVHSVRLQAQKSHSGAPPPAPQPSLFASPALYWLIFTIYLHVICNNRLKYTNKRTRYPSWTPIDDALGAAEFSPPELLFSSTALACTSLLGMVVADDRINGHYNTCKRFLRFDFYTVRPKIRADRFCCAPHVTLRNIPFSWAAL